MAWLDLGLDYLSKENSKNIQDILVKVRQFIEDEVIPLEKDIKGYNFKVFEPKLQEKRRKVKELGLWCPQMPKEYGGMGLNLVEFGYVAEELGRSPWGHYVFNCQAPDSGNMEVLLKYGSEKQKERFLWPLTRGDIRSCFSIVEPNTPGSNPTWIETTAKRAGQNYLINGHKWFTSSADGASFAIVMAITNPGHAKHHRASQIIVPTNTPGFRLLRNIPFMGPPGEGWASHGEILYENVEVPASNLLGTEGDGFAIAQERLGPGRIHHCMRWIGICERALDLMCRRAVGRQLAPDTPLASQQTVQNWIAESRAEINASRLLVLSAANKINSEGQFAARNDISLIKFYVAGVLQRVLDRAIQVHGAFGLTDATPLAFWFAHERAARIYDGPDEVHKRSVSREILSKYSVRKDN